MLAHVISLKGSRHHCRCSVHAFARRSSWRLENGESSRSCIHFLLVSCFSLGKRARRLSGSGPAYRLWARNHAHRNPSMLWLHDRQQLPSATVLLDFRFRHERPKHRYVSMTAIVYTAHSQLRLQDNCTLPHRRMDKERILARRQEARSPSDTGTAAFSRRPSSYCQTTRSRSRTSRSSSPQSEPICRSSPVVLASRMTVDSGSVTLNRWAKYGTPYSSP
jgi:hypothetical protein